MADGVIITSGTGVTIATDDDGSAQHQWVKIEIGANGSFVPVTTANGLPVQILSLPDLGLNSAVKITSLPDLGLNSVVKITSLPDLGLNSVVKITSLPDLGLNSSVKITSLPALTAASATVTNLGTFAVQVTSLPDFAIGTSILSTVTNAGTFAVQITSLPDLGLNSVVKITSLPDLGLNSSVKITSLPALGFGGLVSISNGTIVSVSNGTIISVSNGTIVSVSNGTIISITNLVPVLVSDNAYRFVVGQATPISGYFRFTSTYTSAQTNVVLTVLPASTTALHLTDCLFSCADTHGNFTLLESPSNGAARTVLDRLFFRDYGGAVLNFTRPLVLDTNSALIFTSRSATNHSVTVVGYAR